jgi:EAL domain-containing protein (putative c-di-GMP-specific phosphodiesterase class I)/DNA-binding response OmpR family regulator
MADHERARIYIVDDEPANRRLLERILERDGFHDVHSFEDGAAVLAGVEADEPDLILLDLHMPALDGFAVLDALKAGRPEDDYLPILVLTADAHRDARSRALASGARDFLIKPFDALEVTLRVRNLLEARLLHRALRARNVELVEEIDARTTELRATEQQWATVTAALSRLETLESPEATAQAICDELATLPNLGVVTVLAFGAGGTTIPLGRSLSVEARFGINRPLPEAWSRRFRELTADGPWIGAWPAEGETFEGAPLRLDDLSALALLPLRTRTRSLGILGVGTSVTNGVAFLGRRVHALEGFAALISAILAQGISERQRGGELRERIAAILAERAFRPVFQPIADLSDGRTVGFEALTRFADGTRPDRRFADAAAVGLGLELETACLEAAIDAAGDLPTDAWLSLNVSPGLIIEEHRLREILARSPCPVVLEITEHVPIVDYTAFRRSLKALGTDVRYAVDDAGAGFSSFRHILELRPDFVKLDIELVRAIERDPARQAFVAGMVYFAMKTGSTLIAEGIESDPERATLRDLLVALGQGFLLGRPGTVLAQGGPPTDPSGPPSDSEPDPVS